MTRVILSLSVLALSTACGGDAAGPAVDPVGDYQLVAYDGHPLPYQIGSNIAGTEEIVAGTETLGADSLYSEHWTTRSIYYPGYGCGCVDTSSGFVDSGRYELAGSRLTLHSGWTGTAINGSLVNGVLTYASPIRSLRFEK